MVVVGRPISFNLLGTSDFKPKENLKWLSLKGIVQESSLGKLITICYNKICHTWFIIKLLLIHGQRPQSLLTWIPNHESFNFLVPIVRKQSLSSSVCLLGETEGHGLSRRSFIQWHQTANAINPWSLLATIRRFPIRLNRFRMFSLIKCQHLLCSKQSAVESAS